MSTTISPDSQNRSPGVAPGNSSSPKTLNPKPLNPKPLNPKNPHFLFFHGGFRPREVSGWIRTAFFIQSHTFRPQIHHSGFSKHQILGLGFGGWGDFRETIPVCFNFGYRHILFLYPNELSYSSSNAYIKKIRVRELGKPTRLLKNLKNT